MSDSKKYYWLKLKEDFFDSKEIKLLRRVAGGDTFTIIYLKLLLKSLKTEGKLYFEGVCTDFAEEISLDIDEDVENVKLTLAYLEKKNLIEFQESEELVMSRIPEMIGSETSKAEFMRKKRAREAKEVTMLPSEVTQLPDVTNCYTEIEIEKEIEQEIEKRKDSPPALDYQKIVDLYHAHCHKLPKIKKLDDNRRKTLKAWGNMDEILEVIEKTGKSDFLAGKNDRSWTANFDWIIQPKNRIKILEGTYDSKAKTPNVTPFNDYDQRSMDYGSIERQMLGMEEEQ